MSVAFPACPDLSFVLQIKEFHSYCGGLPAPECSGNPLGYKFSWSPRGGLLALLNSASYLANGQQVDVRGEDLMGVAKPYYVTPAFAFVAYPNRNSVPFRKYCNIRKAETAVRGTLRYRGFPQFVQTFKALGWMDIQRKAWLKEGMTWAEVFQQAIGAADASERCASAALYSASALMILTACIVNG